MGQRISQVDSFTAEPFRGNPAGVCVLDGPRPDCWMADVAREMNLSETAFLLAEGDGYRLRWFTPTTEVELCGHATLASAHILWEEGHLEPGETARFFTLSGLLTAEKREGGWVALDFPGEPAVSCRNEAPPGLVEALGLGDTPSGAVRFIGRNRFDYLVEVDDPALVRRATPDFVSLERLAGRGVILTSPSDREAAGAHFISRFFAPAVGVPEDPVTGSAHCCLGPYWAERLGKLDVVGYQASARGGTVRVKVKGDRVEIEGRAVTVFRGELA